jgi:hypothetical protein
VRGNREGENLLKGPARIEVERCEKRVDEDMLEVGAEGDLSAKLQPFQLLSSSSRDHLRRTFEPHFMLLCTSPTIKLDAEGAFS